VAQIPDLQWFLRRWAWLVALTGCNYALDFETRQCRTTDDCRALGAGFEATECRAGSCVAPGSLAGPEPNLGEPGSGCVSTAQCIADNRDEPFVCRRPGEPCTALKSPECPLVFGDFDDDQAVYFGAFLNVPESAPLSQVSTLNVELAVNEFNDSVGGLPGGPLGKLRPLVGVVCRNDPELVEPASTHLFEDVGVPAVLAHLPSAALKQFFVDHALPEQRFVINPGFADNSLTSISSDGLFWHVIGDIRDVAPAYPPLLSRIESFIASPTPIRVAMVVSKRFAEQSIADTLTPLLEFNGKSVVENGDDFYVASVPALPDEPSYDYSELNAALLDFRPHVVIAITREEFVYKILPPVESAWDSVAEGQARPFYVVPTALSGNLDLLEYVSVDSSGASSESKRQRIVGVAPASAEDMTLYNQFLIRFRSAFPRFENPGGFENFYDAVYLLANAMFAAGSVPELRGLDVARGMQRVIDGNVEISVGPTFIADGFTALAAGGEIRLLGTMGPADFDPGVGARRGNASVYCIERSDSEGGLAFAYDVLRYDGEADLAGNFPCFSGF
jgi:ABC-type branched-subunit amino acid transport system substrate-binding protein